jgi:hypothetical protein
MAWRGPARLEMIARLARSLAADPGRVGRAIPGHFRMQLTVRLQRWRLESVPAYEVDEAWEERYHRLLGAPWPCPHGPAVEALLDQVRAHLAGQGLGYGRQTYGCYSDADGSLCRAVWCAILHTRPEVVVETGVAHGITSRIVLEALESNDRGRLWSIDLPHLFDRRLHVQTGAAVTDGLRGRWTYLEGSSRERLPALTAELGRADIFIHDSLHTARNTVFEMAQAASVMSPGGVMLIDDITTHTGFAAFCRRDSGYQAIVAPSADGTGHFGIAVKTT